MGLGRFFIISVSCKVNGKMWVLLWLQVMNNKVTHYELGQFGDSSTCARAKDEAKVLITNSNIVTYCLEITSKQEG